jgi:hypothetical protein
MRVELTHVMCHHLLISFLGIADSCRIDALKFSRERQARLLYLETKMGDVIAFKPVKDGVHMRPPPEGSAKIITFTGGWHAPMSDQEGNSARGLGKAAWYERCRNNFLCSLGLLWPWGTAFLRVARNRSGEAMLAATSAPSTIPGEAKLGGMSS